MTVISRLQLDHPALGAAGGAGLHSSVEAIYTKIGDHMNSRFFVQNALANAASQDFEHNFKCAFAELRYILFLRDTGTGELTRIDSASTPSISQFTIAATPSFLTTKLRVTNNSGASRDIAIIIVQGKGAEILSDLEDINFSTPPEDGQALVYSASGLAWLPGASGDASFKLQAVSTPNATIKGGFLILDDGRELATFNATYGADLTVSLTTIFGSAPANATAYYLYIDKNLLGTQQTETATGRKLYQVTQSQLALSTTSPESIDLARYYPIGLVRSADSGTAWSGTGSQFKNLAVRRHQIPSVNVSPLKETVTRIVSTVGGASTQLAGGHVLDISSFPSASSTANLSFYNLVNGSPNDAYGSRNLTATGSPTGDTSILGVANGATALNGSTQYFSSTDAFFDAGDNDFACGAWFKATDWTPATTNAFISMGGAGDVSLEILLIATTGTIRFYYPIDASNQGSIDYSNSFIDGSWHHVAARYKASTDTWYFYVDGSVVATIVQANRLMTSDKFYVGANSTAGQKLTGSIDELFFTKQAMTDDDIRKIASSKITWTNTLSASNQRIEAEYVYGDFKSQIDSDFIVDKDDDKLYCDFSGLPSTAQVSVKMYDAGLSATVIPIRSYDATFTATPGATIAHGLPSMPTAFVVLHDENADGKYVPLNPQDYLKADATNIYTAGFGALTIDGTHPLRIVAAIGQTSAAWAKDFSDNLTPVMKTKTTTYTAVKGDKIFADTSGGAFTITLPASAAYGDVIEFYDPKDTWDTASVTVARNGHNINGVASDLTLDVEGGSSKLVYFDVTQGWRVY